jgi:hypothetical protein
MKNLKIFMWFKLCGITWSNIFSTFITFGLKLFKLFLKLYIYFNTILQALFLNKYILASHNMKSKFYFLQQVISLCNGLS